MKKIISILLIAAILCIGFTACSKDNSPDSTSGKTSSLPVIEEIHEVEKFKAEDGTVSYILDITLPKITENVSEDIIDIIDFHYSQIRDEAYRYAEANVENARNFMRDIGDGKTPWQRTITFETVYSSEDYLSVELTDLSSMMGGNTSPTVSATLFNLKTASAVSLYDLSKTDEETLKQTVAKLMTRKLSESFYSDGTELTDEQKQAIADSFDPYDFCYAADGITIYINRLLIDQSYSGTLCYKFSFSELGRVINPLYRLSEETTNAE